MQDLEVMVSGGDRPGAVPALLTVL